MRKTKFLLLAGTVLPAFALATPSFAEVARPSADAPIVLAQRADDGDGGGGGKQERREQRQERRDNAGGAGGDRPARAERTERPEKADRPERAERPEKADRPERAERPEKADRPERAERPEKADRPERTERPDNAGGARPDRMERPDKAERPEKTERPGRAGGDSAPGVQNVTPDRPRPDKLDKPDRGDGGLRDKMNRDGGGKPDRMDGPAGDKMDRDGGGKMRNDGDRPNSGDGDLRDKMNRDGGGKPDRTDGPSGDKMDRDGGGKMRNDGDKPNGGDGSLRDRMKGGDKADDRQDRRDDRQDRRDDKVDDRKDDRQQDKIDRLRDKNESLQDRIRDNRRDNRDGPDVNIRIDALKGQRRERRDGDRIIITEPGGRTIIRDGNRTIIRRDEGARFRIGARDVREERRGGEIRTVVTRPDGSRVITVTDEDGRLLRRIREQGGREYVLIDNSPRGGGGRGGYFVDLDVREPRISIPRERYILDDEASQGDMEEAFEAEPVERPQRSYSLDEIRQSAPLRSYVRSVDLDAVTFDSGSWEVRDDQIGKLEKVGKAMESAIKKNPRAVFMIEGHTDAVGADEDNLSLSDRRAESVAEVITKYFEVPAENLTTQGYGEQYLKVKTDGDEERNRRVTVRNITSLLSSENAK